MTMVKDGKTKQLWRIESGKWKAICMIPSGELKSCQGNEMLLPVGVRP
jgi:hypothetical protein